MTLDIKARLRRFCGCRAFWTAIVCTLSYIVLALTIPAQALLELVRITAATTALIVVIAFSFDAWESVTTDKPDRTDSLVIGIWLLSLSNFILNFWLLLYRLANRPEWMLQVVTFGFLSGWMAALANILMVWAPGVLRRAGHDAEVPPARLRAVGLAASLGLFGALVVLSSQPNAAWLVERIRPWLP